MKNGNEIWQGCGITRHTRISHNNINQAIKWPSDLRPAFLWTPDNNPYLGGTYRKSQITGVLALK